MNSSLETLARRLAAGEITLEQFLVDAGRVSEVQLTDSTLDVDRQRRCGFPEVVYGDGKTAESIYQIITVQRKMNIDVLATRISAEKAAVLLEHFPDGSYHQSARTFRVPSTEQEPSEKRGKVAVVTAGTSDLPVADEASETLDWMHVEVLRIHDVGVAGPQRLISHLPDLRVCDAIVVVAGLEGALPSVVGGHVACPIVAVPTSIGYGASFGGVAALLGMLNSCASNVTVVNIDAGFKAGYIAGLIATRVAAARDS